MTSRRQVRQGRALRILAAAPRVAEMTYTSAHIRFVPVIRSRHRIQRRGDAPRD